MSKVTISSEKIDYLEIEVGFWADNYLPIDELLDWLNEQKIQGATHLKGSGYSDVNGDVESISFASYKITPNTNQ